jgi:hypothetical protein
MVTIATLCQRQGECPVQPARDGVLNTDKPC